MAMRCGRATRGRLQSVLNYWTVRLECFPRKRRRRGADRLPTFKSVVIRCVPFVQLLKYTVCCTAPSLVTPDCLPGMLNGALDVREALNF
eukprot:6460405-Amphidinium_carterae.1